MNHKGIKRVGIFILAVVLFLSSSLSSIACDDKQTNVYVSKILFGDDAIQYKNNKSLELLESALYICSEQSNRDGQGQLNLLKKAKVGSLPTLDKVNLSNDFELYDCAHNSWEHVYSKNEEIQSERKNILRNTLVKVFDFGWFNEIFKTNSGQIDSFAALLYYTHILADYLADDPEDTELSVNGVEAPAYSGEAIELLNGNKPNFTNKQKKENKSYIKFKGIDSNGRTGEAYAVLGVETLAPPDSRQDIGYIKPSGWNQKKYEGIVNSQPPYIYNRCHLIAHQLANKDIKENLITGTRYMNEAMIPYEESVASYIKETGNHVIYRATPIYKGNNLVANGIQLEAYSVEDKGKGIQFNAYFYNVQPGIDIKYGNGETTLADKTINNNDIIPFAIINPNDKNPDLMYEIRKQLERLFAGQKESADYKDMMRDLQTVEDKARRKGEATDAKEYQAMKTVHYEYVETLSKYLPVLLGNEKFFISAFKK